MPSLQVYRDFPLNSGTETDQVDVFTGDGVTTSFALVNKLGTRVANTILVGNVYFEASNGDFSVVGNNVVFPTAPATSTIIIVPGISNILAGIVFDTLTVPGLTNPNIIQFAVWVGDTDTPDLYSYTAAPGNSGIKIEVVDLNTSLGAAVSWTQFAPANADGSAGTFLSAGAPIYTPAISAADNVTTHASSGATAIKVTNSSLFLAGDYVKIGSGLSTAEVVQITSIPDGVTLDVIATNYAHNIGETVFTCARKIWIKVTVPNGAVGGQAINLIDNSIRRTYVVSAKP